jgi:hypothetical protein
VQEQYNCFSFWWKHQQLQEQQKLWDGTSWASAPPMATARTRLGGTGTQTAGLAFGGAGSPT